jgi:peptide/nickel transport system ATP-binding protein
MLLRLSRLRVELSTGDPIVEGIEFEMRPGEIVGLVGESGSGKSTTAVSLLGYATAGARIVSGELEIAGTPRPMSDAMRPARGRDITYVPQNPGTSLNPAQRVGRAIEQMIAVHRPDRLTPDAAERMLDIVGLPGTDAFARRFPHQLSGGQQQRVCIATSLACDPSVVVLDEPTTGLDVVTQARILRELVRLRDEQGVAMLYVTHDLSVVAQIADRIMVMYAGRIVEEGSAPDVLRRPRHPYTCGLMASIPDHAAPTQLEPMPGLAAAVGERPPGCAFAPRCPIASPGVCDVETPERSSRATSRSSSRFATFEPSIERDSRPSSRQRM